MSSRLFELRIDLLVFGVEKGLAKLLGEVKLESRKGGGNRAEG